MPPLTLCAYMKKGPNLRWSLIQCSGGDEGDRTPDLLTASQALSQLSYAPVRKSTIRELGRLCKDNFGKLSPPRRGKRGRAADAGAGTGRDALSARGDAPRGRRRCRRPPLRRPWDISSSVVRSLSLSRRGPPSAQRPSRRRRDRYRGRSRSRPPGDSKTMPVYGARPATPGHDVIGKTKTAGRRLENSVKCRVWTAGPGPAP